MKKQEGNYFDSFLKLDIDYDKRNQKFQTQMDLEVIIQ